MQSALSVLRRGRSRTQPNRQRGSERVAAAPVFRPVLGIAVIFIELLPPEPRRRSREDCPHRIRARSRGAPCRCRRRRLPSPCCSPAPARASGNSLSPSPRNPAEAEHGVADPAGQLVDHDVLNRAELLPLALQTGCPAPCSRRSPARSRFRRVSPSVASLPVCRDFLGIQHRPAGRVATFGTRVRVMASIPEARAAAPARGSSGEVALMRALEPCMSAYAERDVGDIGNPIRIKVIQVALMRSPAKHAHRQQRRHDQMVRHPDLLEGIDRQPADHQPRDREHHRRHHRRVPEHGVAQLEAQHDRQQAPAPRRRARARR